MFVLLWLNPLLLTIALVGPVAEKKVSWYLKNYLKNRQPFYIGNDYIKCSDSNIKVLNNEIVIFK